MKRTNPNNATARVPKFDLEIDAEPLNELRGLLDQRKKLDDAVNSAPSEIAAGEAELADLRHRLAILEADVVLIDDAALPEMQNQIANLSEVIDAKDLAFRRLKGRLKALEDRAPELDNKIEIAIGYVRVDANIAAQNLQAALAVELRSKVADLRNIYAQVRALLSAAPLVQSSDFLACAHVPDLETCMVSYARGGIPHDTSQNLLALRDDATTAAEAEIAEAIRPITEALLVASKHKPYVPLAKRPVPYVRKGAYDGPGGRVDRPEDTEPKEEPPKMKTIEEAMAEPYTIKGDSSGIRTWNRQAATELDMGRAIMQAAESRDQ